MRGDRSWRRRARRGAARALCTALLGGMGALCACGAVTGAEAPDAATQPEASTGQEGSEQAITGAAAEEIGAALDRMTAETSAGGEDGAPTAWADECFDRHGDITAYAVLELRGAQLETVLEQQGYVWSERSQMWLKEDGSSALTVLDDTGDPLPKAAVAELGAGASEASVSYRLVTSGYSTPQRAFDELVGKVLACDDSQFARQSGVGVAYGPSMRRALALVTRSNDVYVVSVFGEEAVAAGLLDAATGRELGATADAAFEALTGRAPGARR